MDLTRTRLHTGSSKAELPIRIWFGLICGRVVDRRRRAVLLTHTAVIEVTTSLQSGKGMNPRHETPPLQKDPPKKQDSVSITYQTV